MKKSERLQKELNKRMSKRKKGSIGIFIGPVRNDQDWWEIRLSRYKGKR
jgi:molybdopterin synthase catalytic subunit